MCVTNPAVLWSRPNLWKDLWSSEFHQLQQLHLRTKTHIVNVAHDSLTEEAFWFKPNNWHFSKKEMWLDKCSDASKLMMFAVSALHRHVWHGNKMSKNHRKQKKLWFVTFLSFWVYATYATGIVGMLYITHKVYWHCTSLWYRPHGLLLDPQDPWRSSLPQWPNHTTHPVSTHTHTGIIEYVTREKIEFGILVRQVDR